MSSDSKDNTENQILRKQIIDEWKHELMLRFGECPVSAHDGLAFVTDKVLDQEMRLRALEAVAHKPVPVLTPDFAGAEKEFNNYESR